jgi:hypothetical protein
MKRDELIEANKKLAKELKHEKKYYKVLAASHRRLDRENIVLRARIARLEILDHPKWQD